MAQNLELVETIKDHFAQKSSADLRAILEARDTATMSDEAFVAAEAVLGERVRGDATEPGRTAPPGPPDRPWPDHALAWGLVWVLRGFALLGAICGGVLGFEALGSYGVGREALWAAFQGACAVVIPLTLAEGLRLGILIAENTRRSRAPRA